MSALTKPHILVVDDDDRIRQLLTRYLSQQGYWVSAAPDAAAARVQMNMLKFHLAILDVMMPVMDGLAALAELRRRPDLCHIPVVFMTAKVQRAEVEHYRRMGAAGVIRKPFDPMSLPDELRRIVDGR